VDITHLTYTVVKYDAQIPDPVMEPVDQVRDYLTEHLGKFLEATRSQNAQPAGYFENPLRQNLFRDLHEGSDAKFLAAYRELAVALVGRMNGATKEGLLVGVRASSPDDGVVAALMKLEVVLEHGATLSSHAIDGRVQLAAVKDVLEKPGKLQKCAMVTSNLPEHRVFCKDQQQDQAKYFPEAFGIKVHPRPRMAMRVFYDVIGELQPELTQSIAEAIATCSPGPAEEVLAEVAGKVPGISSDLQADIVERLRARDRPVTQLDPTQSVKGVYKIGPITITGPLAVLEDMVRRRQLEDGSWRVTIDSQAKPDFSSN
jgi:putative lipoic acid-binding regulatory protein